MKRRENALEGGLSPKEKVKAIFKKYGFIVTAVLLAVGTIIGVILSSLSNGNNLAPFRFVFRTAGQVICKNAWLLILAVAAFLIERVTKRDKVKNHYFVRNALRTG